MYKDSSKRLTGNEVFEGFAVDLIHEVAQILSRIFYFFREIIFTKIFVKMISRKILPNIMLGQNLDLNLTRVPRLSLLRLILIKGRVPTLLVVLLRFYECASINRPKDV